MHFHNAEAAEAWMRARQLPGHQRLNAAPIDPEVPNMAALQAWLYRARRRTPDPHSLIPSTLTPGVHYRVICG